MDSCQQVWSPSWGDPIMCNLDSLFFGNIDVALMQTTMTTFFAGSLHPSLLTHSWEVMMRRHTSSVLFCSLACHVDMLWSQIFGKLVQYTTSFNSLRIQLNCTNISSFMAHFVHLSNYLLRHLSRRLTSHNPCWADWVLLWTEGYSTLCHHQSLITVEANLTRRQRMLPIQCCVYSNLWCFDHALSVGQDHNIIVWGSPLMFVSDQVGLRFSIDWLVTRVGLLVYLWLVNPIVGETARVPMFRLIILYWYVHAEYMLYNCVFDPVFRFKHTSAGLVCELRRPSIVQLDSS
jgi:hypothetical protein